jgi:hypothetical protein
MKTVKRILETHIKEHPVWCDECYIRIAPYDKHVVVGRKLYHPRCYSRLMQMKIEVDKEAFTSRRRSRPS